MPFWKHVCRCALRHVLLIHRTAGLGRHAEGEADGVTLDVADAEHIPVVEGSVCLLLPVDVRAVGAPQVGIVPLGAVELEPPVVSGDIAMQEHDVIVRRTSHCERRPVEGDLALRLPDDPDDQAGLRWRRVAHLGSDLASIDGLPTSRTEARPITQGYAASGAGTRHDHLTA